MKDYEILNEVARFDGLQMITVCSDCNGEGVCGFETDHWPCDRCSGTGKVPPYYKSCPDYLHSLNAIVPVVLKLENRKPWSSNPQDYPIWQFSGYLLQELGIKLWDNGTPLRPPFEIAWLILQATPRQICIALLKALDKWKD